MKGDLEFALRVQINTTNSSIEYARKSIKKGVPFEIFITLMEKVVMELQGELAELKTAKEEQ